VTRLKAGLTKKWAVRPKAGMIFERRHVLSPSGLLPRVLLGVLGLMSMHGLSAGHSLAFDAATFDT